ncbi:hypothetical protein [Vibrio phage pTD1]|uniref:Uncharacterized protein n=1 Tax=Vibrio phage pTD1 TaxID=1938577 RepID=A0A1Q2U2Y2_9CAUD|nr:hypothetical protein FDH33_gp126 [Vibrio phage pTD1]BAW98335.1 hypothetical protein [Vibrio phage pTD1]
MSKDYVNVQANKFVKPAKVVWYRTNGAICALMASSLYVAIQYGNW